MNTRVGLVKAERRDEGLPEGLNNFLDAIPSTGFVVISKIKSLEFFGASISAIIIFH